MVVKDTNKWSTASQYPELLIKIWGAFWMKFSGLSPLGRLATWIATWFSPPYKARKYLAKYSPKGFVSPSSSVFHDSVYFGENVFIGDRVTIFQNAEGGSVTFGDQVHLHQDSCIETGEGGRLRIGSNTHIQQRCQFSAYKGSIVIGDNTQIAPNCAFYSYSHATELGKSIMDLPLASKGGIVVDDEVWLGYGVVILDGVHLGKGCVIGAGSVVTHDIPDNAIAAGVPAKVIKMRTSAAQVCT